MPTTIPGTVTNGVVVPNSPLPEGATSKSPSADASPEIRPDSETSWRHGSGAARKPSPWSNNKPTRKRDAA